MKIRVENQQEEKEQREQRSRDRQQQEQNYRDSVLPCRAQPNATSYDSCQSGKDRQPRQNIECPYPAAGSQRKEEIERHRCNNGVDEPEEPKPKLHGIDPNETQDQQPSYLEQGRQRNASSWVRCIAGLGLRLFTFRMG